MAGSSSSVWIIYALIVSYALCYQLQSPIQPFLVDKLVGGSGAESTIAYGRVQSFFSVAQGIGSLVMGYILDRYGVRVGLIVNFVACALQYGILAMTDSLGMLFLSKVPGMMMGGFLCAQTAIARMTPHGPERVKALGRLTTAYTIGGVTGPYIGGILGSSGDYFLGAQFATAGSLLAVVAVLALPKQLDDSTNEQGESKKDDDKDDDAKCQAAQPWLSQAALVLKLAGMMLSIKVITGIANNMARSVQPLILKNDLKFDEAMMGKVMSGQFAFGGISNGFLLAPLTAALGGSAFVVVRNCIGIMGAVYVCEAFLFAPSTGLLLPGEPLSGAVYVGLSLFLSMFQYSLSTSITVGTQGIVPQHLLGTMMGIEHSIFSVAGMLGPLVGTYVFQSGGLSLLAFACGAIFFSILPLWASIQPATNNKVAA